MFVAVALSCAVAVGVAVAFDCAVAIGDAVAFEVAVAKVSFELFVEMLVIGIYLIANNVIVIVRGLRLWKARRTSEDLCS